MSGKLKDIKVPEIILTRLIGYYHRKDPELLEKAILNLNLSHYRNNIEVRMICE